MATFTQKLKARFVPKAAPPLSLLTDELIRSLNLIIDLDPLLDNLSAKLRELLDADTVYVVLLEPITNRYVGKKAKGNDPDRLTAFNFSRSDSLIRWLSVNQCPLDVIRQLAVVQFLSGREQEVLRKTDCVLVIPFIVINRLTGALFLSRTRTGETYGSDEMAFLSRIAEQSALAIEHALMVQFQEEKLKRLFHADQLATVGELATGIAHEIRNPLTSIRSTVQYVQKDLSEDKRRLIDGIIEEVDRIDQIIGGLLSFSRSSELHIDQLDVEDVLDQMLQLSDSELRKHDITVHRRCELAHAQIPADASQLKQVFLNILLNSIQAMPDGGTITIATTESTGVEQRGHPRGAVCVTISDTGPGIPEQYLPHVFNPFYTTKETGTGLGLSISYGIVSQHGGEIEIESHTEGPHTGTTVIIRLPFAPLTPVPAPVVGKRE